MKKLGRAAQAAVTAVLALLLACNLYTLAAARLTGDPNPSVFGWSSAVIASGSMEPALQVGDLILIHAQQTYAPGDIITFRSGGSLVTHRIVGQTALGFITQGDANNAADAEPVWPEAVEGRVAGRIPGAGRVIAALRTPLGMTLLVLLGLVLLELPPMLQKIRRAAGEGAEDD